MGALQLRAYFGPTWPQLIAVSTWELSIALPNASATRFISSSRRTVSIEPRQQPSPAPDASARPWPRSPKAPGPAPPELLGLHPHRRPPKSAGAPSTPHLMAVIRAGAVFRKGKSANAHRHHPTGARPNQQILRSPKAGLRYSGSAHPLRRCRSGGAAGQLTLTHLLRCDQGHNRHQCRYDHAVSLYQISGLVRDGPAPGGSGLWVSPDWNSWSVNSSRRVRRSRTSKSSQRRVDAPETRCWERGPRGWTPSTASSGSAPTSPQPRRSAHARRLLPDCAAEDAGDAEWDRRKASSRHRGRTDSAGMFSLRLISLSPKECQVPHCAFVPACRIHSSQHRRRHPDGAKATW